MTYNDFIQNIINTRGQCNIPDGEYKERHHIVPRCMNGPDDRDNIIWLYAQEHYEAHKLLAEENPENEGLVYAWWCMIIRDPYNKRQIEITPEEYEEAKIRLSELQRNKHLGVHPWNYGLPYELQPRSGKKCSDIHKQRISESQWRKRKVLCIDTGKIYNSVKEAHDKTGISNIDRVCRGLRPYAGGLRWKYIDTDKYDNIISNIKYKEPIISISKCKPVRNVETGEIFNSIKEASNWCKGNVGAAIRRGNAAGGYHWEFINLTSEEIYNV